MLKRDGEVLPMEICPHCGTRVFLTTDGVCPSCRRPVSGTEESVEAAHPGTRILPSEKSAVRLEYAGFWRRAASMLLDFLIWLPVALPTAWLYAHDRSFCKFVAPLNLMLGVFYSVYLVQRYGGTPGKLVMGMRIRKTTGEPVGFREAILRHLPSFVLGTLSVIWLCRAVGLVAEAEFMATPTTHRFRLLLDSSPWHGRLQLIASVWTWSELLVMLCNEKRRALHDFIAGTVVVVVRP